jgi:PAS domain S-box-containing protein
MMNRCRVLIVEDEAVVAMDIEERLTGIGYEVIGHAVSGEHALSLAEEGQPDLVLMDIRLKGAMDGVTAAEELCRRFHLPVILLTAYSEDETVKRAKHTEPLGYLLKPFNDGELRSTIEIALHKHRAEEQLLRMNRLFDTLSQVSQTIVRSRSREELLPAVCRKVVEHGGLDLAWIGRLDPDTLQMEPVAQFGKGGELLREIDLGIEGRLNRETGPGTVFRDGMPLVCRPQGGEVHPDDSLGEYDLMQHGFQSCFSFPFHLEKGVRGVLNLCSSVPDFFGEKEIGLFQELAFDVSFALERIQAEEQRNHAESALRESEARYRRIVDTANEGIWQMDGLFMTTYVNRNMAEMLGYDPSDMVGRHVASFMFSDDLEDHEAQMAARVKGQDGSYTRRFRHKEGFEVWTRVNSTPLMDDQNHFQGSFGMFADITVQKRTEDALRESENSLRGLFDAVRESLLVLDPDGWVIACNRTIAERLNKRPDQLIGTCIYDHLSPEVAARRRCWFEEVTRRDTPMVFEDERNGRWLHHSISPIHDPGGGVSRLVLFAVDLTRQKRAEEALRASMEFLDRILDVISDPISVKDHEHRYVLANEAICRLTGCGKDGLLGNTDQDLLPSEQAMASRTEDEEVLQTGRESVDEKVITDTAGQIRTLLTRKSRYIDSHGRSYVVGVTHDITDRKRTENIRAARLRLMNLALTHSMDDLLQATLDEAEALTGSLVGFYHFLGADQETLSLQAWSTRTIRQFCLVEGKGLHYGVKEAGVWVDCIQQRGPIIHNDFQALSHRKGMPQGHARITRQLVVPVFRGERIVAILGVGNKPTHYDEKDIEAVSHLADLARDIAEHKLAAESITERDRRMRTLLENLPGAVYRCANDKNRSMAFLSEGCKAITGYAPEDLIGNRRLSYGDLVHPSDREWLWDIWQEVIADRRTFQGEYRIITAGGEEKWVWESGSPVFDTSGRLVALEGFIMDITHRKRAEESIKESEALYRSVVEDAPMLIITFLPDTTLLFVNDACCRYFHRSREEMVGRRFIDWLPEAEGKRIESMIARLTPEEPTVVLENEFVSAEGELRCHRWTNRAIFDHSGKAVVYQGFGEDITQQRSSQADLHRLATAIDQAGETVLITDARGIIEYVNPAFERTTGYSREEAIGQTPRVLKSGRQDRTFYEDLWKTLLAGRVWIGRFTNRRKDGALFEEEAVISPVFDTQGHITQFVAVKRDVSKEVELEARLRQIQKMEAVGQLAGGVAHDFNNMLSPILGYAEMLLDDLHPADDRYDQVMEIKKAGERSRDLTRQLLAFSRKQVLQVKSVELSQIVENMKKLLRRTLREDIRLQIIPGRTRCAVMADVGQVEQVLMNLVVNAQDAMPSGGDLTIEVSRADLKEKECAQHPGMVPGKYGVLTVGDSGLGMDRETLEHIFEPFYSTKGERGTGLGLATVYGVVKQHHGHILVESELKKGTTVRVFLPEGEDARPSLESAQAVPDRLGGEETILVVEDDGMVLRMAGTLLKRHGFKILSAAGGSEALAVLERHTGPVHLLLTDVIMPGMNGKELYEILAQRRPGLKVLYMSGYTDDVIAGQGLLEEGTHLIQKPFTVRDLPAKVRQLLDSQ